MTNLKSSYYPKATKITGEIIDENMQQKSLPQNHSDDNQQDEEMQEKSLSKDQLS